MKNKIPVSFPEPVKGFPVPVGASVSARAEGGKVLTIDASQVKPVRLNPLDFGRMDGDDREWLLDFLSAAAGVTLEDDQRAGYLGVIEALPKGATLADFVRAAREYEAAKLGLSVETYTAVSPLLRALSDGMKTPATI